ncbi:MAG: 1-acyl-sn-glycerol-3-phosphate acyltransferase [Acidimicrobiales bacterium]|nr:1-acyl-sn-glycerol-3-phosphate acyltransferase [Acidimicrobiales bacterium]
MSNLPAPFSMKHPVGTDTWIKPFLRLGRFSAKLARFFVRTDVDLHVLPEPTIIAANHRSLLDFVVGFGAAGEYPRATRILINERYFRSGILARILNRIGAIPTPEKGARDALAGGISELKRGASVIIMPEGKLVKEQHRVAGLGELRKGVSVLAYESGVPVTPVAVIGTERAWPIGGLPRRRLPRRRVVMCRACSPVYLTSTDHDMNLRVLREAMTDCLKSAERQYEERYGREY